MSNNAAVNQDANGGLTPKLRFPEFRDGPVWKATLGSELFNQVNNRQASAGLPILAITQEYGAIPRDVIDYHVSVTDKSVEAYKEVQPGDFIISLRSFQGGIEYSAYHGICSPAYVVLRKRAELSEPFFKHLFKSYNFIQQLTRNLEGLRDGKMISYKQFSELLLPIPNPAEQQKIAECLTSLDEIIAAQSQKIASLKTHKKGLMQQLFPLKGEALPRLRFPEFQGGGLWTSAPMRELLMGTPDYGVNAAAVRFSDGLPKYIRITDISDDGLYLSDKQVSVDVEPKAENYLDEGDIVLARTGGSVGKSYRYRKDDGKLVFAGFLIRIKPDKRQLNSAYLANYLTTAQFWDWVAMTSARSGQPGINSTEISSLTVPLPPDLPEQQRIADCLTSLDELITAHINKLEALKFHKKGLLQQLFPCPEDEA